MMEFWASTVSASETIQARADTAVSLMWFFYPNVSTIDLEYYYTRHGIPNGRKYTIDDDVAGLDYVAALWALHV
jgi:hypothetical protein